MIRHAWSAHLVAAWAGLAAGILASASIRSEPIAFNPISALNLELEELRASLSEGVLASCAQTVSCGEDEASLLRSLNDGVAGSEASLAAYLPQDDQDLIALLARISELRTEVEQAAAAPGLIDRTTISRLLAHADAALLAEVPELAYVPQLPSRPEIVRPTVRSTESQLEQLEAPTGGTASAVTASCDPTDPALLAETDEIEFTPELDALLASLESDPLLIYEYVRNSIRYIPYYGSRRSAASVLEVKGGNDFDQASLLIAALRRLGIPACYVRGTAELTFAQLTAWLGVDEVSAGATILANGYVPGTYVGDAEIEHVWVEAYIDVANYRGVPNVAGGKSWVQLAPAFHEVEDNGGPNLAQQMSFDRAAFKADLTSGTSQGTPQEVYIDDLRASVLANHPGEQLGNLLWRSIPLDEGIDTIPLSLPFRVISRIEATSNIPSSMQHQVTIFAGTLSHTLDFAAIGSKRVTVAYVPATPADEAVIAGYGNIFDTPANLINVRAELNLDGVSIASGSAEPFGSVVTGGVTVAATGYPTQSIHTGTFLAPLATAGRHAFVITPDGRVAGTVTQAHASAFEAGVDEIGQPGFDEDETLGEALFFTGLEYFRELLHVTDTAARSMHLYHFIGTNIAIVTPQFALLTSGGTVIAVEPRGVVITVPVGGGVPLDKGPTSSPDLDYYFVRGMVSSSLENTVLEDIWGIEAVSTFKILQLANDAGIPVFVIDAANRSTLVPQLTHSAATVSQIEAALDAGFHVEVPRDPITLLDWTGTGWLTIDAALGIPLAWQITGFLQGGSLAEIVQHLQELVRTGEITEMEANLILFALFERIHAPVQDAVSSPYGPRRHPITGEQNSFHKGVDYASGTDTPVATVADGFIEVQYISGSFGNTIIINHGVDAQGNTHYTLYAHNNSFEMSLDDFVSQGDIVSLSGNTGSSTDPHVHFELRIVPPGVDGPLPVNGAPTNGAFFDQELTVDPETYVWPEELLLACSPVCP